MSKRVNIYYRSRAELVSYRVRFLAVLYGLTGREQDVLREFILQDEDKVTATTKRMVADKLDIKNIHVYVKRLKDKGLLLKQIAYFGYADGVVATEDPSLVIDFRQA